MNINGARIDFQILILFWSNIHIADTMDPYHSDLDPDKIKERTCLALNWPKLAWCKVRWNVFTMYAVQLICNNVFFYFFFI